MCVASAVAVQRHCSLTARPRRHQRAALHLGSRIRHAWLARRGRLWTRLGARLGARRWSARNFCCRAALIWMARQIDNAVSSAYVLPYVRVAMPLHVLYTSQPFEKRMSALSPTHSHGSAPLAWQHSVQ